MVNVHGGLGNNIPFDLHNEHVNKLFKEIITNIKANLTDEAMQRSARSVTTLHEIQVIDKSLEFLWAHAHSTRPDGSDVTRVASVVSRNHILSVRPKVFHSRFRSISANPLSNLGKKKLLAYSK